MAHVETVRVNHPLGGTMLINREDYTAQPDKYVLASEPKKAPDSTGTSARIPTATTSEPITVPAAKEEQPAATPETEQEPETKAPAQTAPAKPKKATRKRSAAKK